MSIIKRLSTTLVSRIDQVVGEFENHEALVRASLSEIRTRVAQARVRYSRIHREAAQLRDQLAGSRENAARWRQRATQCADSDEKRALDCLERARQCDQEAERLARLGNEYTETEAKLKASIQTMERRLAELDQKHNVLRARESASVALSATGPGSGSELARLEGTFERWEENVLGEELAHMTVPATDTLENTFLEEERNHSLQEELRELMAREKGDDR